MRDYQANCQWNGASVQRKKKKKDDSSRELLGFITSAIYDRPKGRFRAIGFCGCEQLQRLVSQSNEHGIRETNVWLAITCSYWSQKYRPIQLGVHTAE